VQKCAYWEGRQKTSASGVLPMHQFAAADGAASLLLILASNVEVVTEALSVSNIVQRVWNYLLVAEKPGDGGCSDADLVPEFASLARVSAAVQQKMSNRFRCYAVGT
jgi:hypothetical protein